VELIDTAGWETADNGINEQAQTLGRQQREQADLVLLCVEAGQAPSAEESQLLRQRELSVLGVATKCDQGKPLPEWPATSALTGMGVENLRTLLAERARAHAQPALAPSISRCRHHVEACLLHLRRAHSNVLESDPPEILALELREALEELGAMVGAVYTDDLLDRIFSRFCIGK
jgi:tRNA modification GTPase